MNHFYGSAETKLLESKFSPFYYVECSFHSC